MTRLEKLLKKIEDGYDGVALGKYYHPKEDIKSYLKERDDQLSHGVQGGDRYDELLAAHAGVLKSRVGMFDYKYEEDAS